MRKMKKIQTYVLMTLLVLAYWLIQGCGQKEALWLPKQNKKIMSSGVVKHR